MKLETLLKTVRIATLSTGVLFIYNTNYMYEFENKFYNSNPQITKYIQKERKLYRLYKARNSETLKLVADVTAATNNYLDNKIINPTYTLDSHLSLNPIYSINLQKEIDSYPENEEIKKLEIELQNYNSIEISIKLKEFDKEFWGDIAGKSFFPGVICGILGLSWMYLSGMKREKEKSLKQDNLQVKS